MINFSILDGTDAVSKLALATIDACKVNKEEDVILVRAFTGCEMSNQNEEFAHAKSRIIKLYQTKGIKVTFDELKCDDVKNKLKWDVPQLFDFLLEADVHAITTHISQQLVGKRHSYNIQNIESNIERLRYHIGIPMSNRLDCEVWRQSKAGLSKILADLNVGLPTWLIQLHSLEYDDEGRPSLSTMDKDNVQRFFEDTQINCPYCWDDRFVVKVDHTTNSNVKGRKVGVKYTKGLHGRYGLFEIIQQQIDNIDVREYYSNLLIQPRIQSNREAKVRLLSSVYLYSCIVISMIK